MIAGMGLIYELGALPLALWTVVSVWVIAFLSLRGPLFRELTAPATPAQLAQAALAGFGLWILIAWIVNWLLPFIPNALESVEAIEQAVFDIPLSMPERLVCFALAPALAEELLFRGLLFRGLKQYMPVWGAIFLSSIAFAAIHGNIPQGVATFFLGSFFATVCHRTASLWPCVTMHAINNAFVLVAHQYTPPPVLVAFLLISGVVGCFLLLKKS